MRLVVVLLVATLLLGPTPLVEGQRSLVLREPVEVYAAAVGETPSGLVGVLANVSVTVAERGAGHIFMDTLPLSQVDMQGSARLAVKVAAAIAEVDPRDYDVFFVVRSGSTVIGGPSAGAVLAVAALAGIANLTVDPTVMMTGTVNPDGSVGPVGGIPQKAAAAAAGNARVFLYPAGQDVVRERTAEGVREVDMRAYCAAELGILCRPVVDVREAVLLMTGHDYGRPPPTGDVQGEAFRAILRPKGAALLAEAEADLAAARAGFDAAELPRESREELAQHLASATEAVGVARDAQGRGEYYVTASKSFQASIGARYVTWSLAYHAAANPAGALTDLREETRRHVAEVGDAARAADWSTLGGLDAVGAAQAKASEAESLLAQADQSLARARQGVGRADASAIYLLAYAYERADTVPWWLEIARETPAGPAVDAAVVLDVTRDVMDAAQESILYARVVLPRALVGPIPALDRAEALLNLSQADLARGATPGALVEAIEADVRVASTLVLAGHADGEVPPELLERARARAARGIADARAGGLEPVLAVSYYEFAPAVPSLADQLAFYLSAQAAASLEGLLAGDTGEGASSRFVGEGRLPDLWVPKEYLVAFFALGIAAGVAAAVGAVVVSKDEKLTEK